MSALEDPTDPRNGVAYQTGKPCIEAGCERPAGTAWSPHWCFPCNVIRMKRIGSSLRQMQAKLNEGQKP